MRVPWFPLASGLALACAAAPTGDDVHEDTLTCGAGTEEVDGSCVAIEVPDTDVEVIDTSVPQVGPGTWSSPLTMLQRLQGMEDHMHISEVVYRESDKRLFSCSYTFDVIGASNPERMRYEFEGFVHETPSGSRRDPGCNHLALSESDESVIYVTHRKNIDFATLLSSWTMAPDPEDEDELVLVQGPALQEEGVSYEGIDHANGLVYAAIHEAGLAIYSTDEAQNFTRIGTLTGLGNAYDVLVSGTTAYVADAQQGVVVVDVSNPAAPVRLGSVSLGAQARDLALNGTTLYVAAGAAGLAVVSVANPAAPTVLATVDTPGTASGVAFDSGRAYIATWNDTRVFDVANPSNPKLIAAVRNTLQQTYGEGGRRPDITARTFGVDASGDTVFVGNWWVPYSYHLDVDAVAPYLFLPEMVNNIGFGTAAVGETRTETLPLENHGTAPLTVLRAWTDNAAFTVSPKQAVIAPGESLSLELTYTASTTDKETTILRILSDDPNQPVRDAYLVGNQPGLGVGVALPTTTGDLLEGGTWSSEDHEGKVQLIAFFATFCPVCGTQTPDLEVQFWNRFGEDPDFAMVALDPNASDTIGGVQEYVEHMGLSFPVGLETSLTYKGIQANYDGANPYPTDLIVDKNGIIRYVAVEYDPETMTSVVEALLAEE